MFIPQSFVALTVALAVSISAVAADAAPRISTAQGVTVTVTPVELGAAKTLSFKLVLDTHSQALTDDLTQTSTLVDSTGRRYPPLAWEGAPPGGHHREGVLRFAPVDPGTTGLELHLQRPGEVAPRVFRWQLQ